MSKDVYACLVNLFVQFLSMYVKPERPEKNIAPCGSLNISLGGWIMELPAFLFSSAKV